MMAKLRPETIENRWDILYAEYPEVYDEWSQIKGEPDLGGFINERFPLRDCIVADIGSGTGISTFDVARYAREVIGVEPEDSMRIRAEEAAKNKGIKNVRFMKGTGQQIPLSDSSVHCVVAATPAFFHNEENVYMFCDEAERITLPGGFIATLNVAPGTYGGELAHIIAGIPKENLPTENPRDRAFAKRGYAFEDFWNAVDYGTVERAVSTFGFIYGKRAIDHIRKNGITVIKEKGRIHYKHLK